MMMKIFFIIFTSLAAFEVAWSPVQAQEQLPTIIEAEEVPIARSARQFLTRNSAAAAASTTKQNPEELVSGESKAKITQQSCNNYYLNSFPNLNIFTVYF